MTTEYAPIGRFREAYQELFPVVYGVALRMVGDAARAEDLSHEAFLRFYEKGNHLPDLNQIKFWLIRVVKNLAYNSEKRKERERRALQRLGRGDPAEAPSPEDVVLREEQRQVVRGLLEEIPFNLRVCLVLREYEGLTYRDIGTILGISEGNVKVRIFRGRDKLARLLEERYGIAP